MKRKILTILLAVALVFSCFTAVYADNSEVLGAKFTVNNTTENKCNMTARVNNGTLNTTVATPFKGISFEGQDSRTFKFVIYNGTVNQVEVKEAYGWAQYYTEELGPDEGGIGELSESVSNGGTTDKIAAGKCVVAEFTVHSGVYWVNGSNGGFSKLDEGSINNGSKGKKVDGSEIGLRFNYYDEKGSNVGVVQNNTGDFYVVCVKSDGVADDEVKQINANLAGLSIGSENSVSAITDWEADEATKGIKTEIDKLTTNTNPGGEGDGDNDKTEETPTPTPAPVLTGVQYTLSDEYNGEFWFTSATSGGVVTAADIKDGTITKSVTVKNNGKEDIEIQVWLQGTVSNRWESVDGGESEKVTVEAGKTAVLTYTCDVENGIVVIKSEDVAVEKLFFRFNVLGEGGEKVLPEGTSFTVYCANETEANYLLSGAMATKEGLTRTGVYDKVSGSVGAGDVLPVAFIALTVVASVALTVVVKKRKEIF